MNFGNPGDKYTGNNRYSAMLGGQQNQQGQGLSPSDAKSAYDAYAQLSGQPSSTGRLMDLLGMGGGGAGAGSFYASQYPTASAAWGAGDFAAFSPTASGAIGSGGGAGAGAGAGATALGFLGPLSVLGLAAYLGYQTGEAHGKEYEAEQRSPEFQRSQSFIEKNPGAISTEGVAPGTELPSSIPMSGWSGNTVWNADNRRYEIDGKSFPEYEAWFEQTFGNELRGD